MKMEIAKLNILIVKLIKLQAVKFSKVFKVRCRKNGPSLLSLNITMFVFHHHLNSFIRLIGFC